MNCYYHPHRPAIMECAKCGVPLCKDCMENACYKLDNRPLCPRCSLECAEENLLQLRRGKVKFLLKMIFSGIFLLIGLVMYLDDPDNIMNAWIYAGIAGLPAAFTATRRTREQKIMDDVHDRYTNDLMDLLSGWLFRFLIRLAFMIFLAPLFALYSFFKHLYGFVTSFGKIRESEEEVEYIQQLLENEGECEGEEMMTQDVSVAHETINPGVAAPQYEARQNVSQGVGNSVYPPQNQRRTYPQDSTVSSSSHIWRNIVLGIVVVVIVIPLLVGLVMKLSNSASSSSESHSYVFANSVMFRSSKLAGVDYNVLASLPYGAEMEVQSEEDGWVACTVDGKEGFVAADYVMNGTDFQILNNLWGGADVKEMIKASRNRRAMLDYCKRHDLTTGKGGWQLFALQKSAKYNNFALLQMKNGYDKFPDFAFIIKDNQSKVRKLALYSFNDETEEPIFLHEEEAPADANIKKVAFEGGQYQIEYTGGATKGGSASDKRASIKFEVPNSSDDERNY